MEFVAGGYPQQRRSPGGFVRKVKDGGGGGEGRQGKAFLLLNERQDAAWQHLRASRTNGGGFRDRPILD